MRAAVVKNSSVPRYHAAAAAFSKQAAAYDRDDAANPILGAMRAQVYDHIDQYLGKECNILELNAGTGIDALRFVKKGHNVHCVEVAGGMVNEIKNKISANALESRWSVYQKSFTDLESVDVQHIDYVFSNMGGLNCTKDLRAVFQPLVPKLNPGAVLTLVIMTHLSPWDWLSFFTLRWRHATRRLGRGPVMAHLLGETFEVFYHSIADTKKALGTKFKLVQTESLGLFLPPPDKTYLPKNFPRLFSMLKKIDRSTRNIFPFNRVGDHVVMTFQYTG